MKFFLTVLLVVCCVLQYTQGQARVQPNARHPAYPGQCYDSVTKTAVKLGATKYNNFNKLTCDSSYTLTAIGCGLIAAPPGCGIASDPSKRHPDCCPKAVC